MTQYGKRHELVASDNLFGVGWHEHGLICDTRVMQRFGAAEVVVKTHKLVSLDVGHAGIDLAQMQQYSKGDTASSGSGPMAPIQGT